MGAVGFCFAHPQFAMHASGLSAAAVAGQFFIVSQVKEFGALVFAATMNLRQVVSILNSFMLYSHPITMPQFFALVLVFASLFYKVYIGYLKGDDSKANKYEKVSTGGVELSKVPQTSPIGAQDEETGFRKKMRSGIDRRLYVHLDWEDTSAFVGNFFDSSIVFHVQCS